MGKLIPSAALAAGIFLARGAMESPRDGQLNERKGIKDGEAMPRLCRSFNVRESKLDAESRSVELTFSSDEPIDMWFGTEILSHEKGAADLKRINSAGSLLFNHKWDDILGVVERAWVGDDKRGHALVRFGKDERGDWAMKQVADGILRCVSFFYRVHEYLRNEKDETYTATKWEAFEISLVTVPADPSVGVGRSEAGDDVKQPVAVRTVASTETAATAVSTQEDDMFKHRSLRAPEGAGGAAAGQPAPSTVSTTTSQVDADRIRQETRAGEVERVQAIFALQRKYNLPQAFIDKVIKDGNSIAEVRGLVLDHIGNAGGGQQPVAGLDHARVDMTEKEKRSYSLLRAIRAVMAGDWAGAGFELEVSRTVAKAVGKDPQARGFFLPSNLPFAPSDEHLRAWKMLSGAPASSVRATYNVGTAAQGGNLVETQLLADSFIEVLRNSLVVSKLGARMLTGLVGQVDIPRRNGTSTAYWVSEAGAITQSEGTFDKVQLRPRTVAALSKMTRLMLLQSTPAIEMLAREDIIAVLALAIDLAAISGTGAGGQPTGIVNQAGVGSVVGGANGANVTFDHTIQLKSKPRIANAPFARPGYAINGQVEGYLQTQKSTTGQYLWVPGGGVAGGLPNSLHGYQYEVSQQLRNTLTKGASVGIASELVFGADWRDLMIGEWGVLELLLNPYGETDFSKGDVALRAMHTVDVALRHGESFAVMSDALTPGF